MDVNETVPEDENELDMLTSAQSTRSSGVKVYDHVPPRVDMDKYQADIPPLLNAQSSKVSYESNLKSALCKFEFVCGVTRFGDYAPCSCLTRNHS